MDLILLVSIFVALLAILLTLLYFKSMGNTNRESFLSHLRSRFKTCEILESQKPAQQPEPAAAGPQLVRNQRRNRVRAAEPQAQQAPANNQQPEDSDGETAGVEIDEKMGAKKRAKLEAKAEKRAQREAELKSREEQKKRDGEFCFEQWKAHRICETFLSSFQLWPKMNARSWKRKKLSRRRNARKLNVRPISLQQHFQINSFYVEIGKAQEERERREHEEYLKMKASFEVQEEGFDEEDSEQDELLQNFIDFIKTSKVVVLEDLAAHFKLKTQAAIDRIVELQKENRLSGVIDDRGKFIYISEDELQAVAKFIRQRGRVSISELAEHSNALINLSSVS